MTTTLAPNQTAAFRKMTRGYQGGWQVGQILRFINISAKTPIPANLKRDSEPYDGPVPEDVPSVDCAEAAEFERALAAIGAPPPEDKLLSSRELAERYGWDEQLFYTCIRGHEFPQPVSWNATSDLNNPGVRCWKASHLDAWDARMLEKLEMLQRIMAKRLVRR